MSKELIYNIIDNKTVGLQLDFVNFVNTNDAEKLTNAIKINSSINQVIITNPDIHSRSQYIQGFIYNTQEQLDTIYDKFDKFISSIFKVISKNKNIITLHLSNIIYNDKRVKKIMLSNLDNLLINNETLQNIDLSKNNLNSDNVKSLFNSLSKNNKTVLKNVNLSYNSIDKIDYVMNFLMQNRTIKNINLSNNQIIDILNLDKVIKDNNVIETIDLSCNKIEVVCFKSKNKFIYSSNNVVPNTSIYDMLNSKLSNQSNNSDANEIKNNILNVMKLFNKYYDDTMKNIVINTINNTNIKKIDLSFNNIYDIKPFFKYVNKVNLYFSMSNNDVFYKNKLNSLCKKYFNVDTVNNTLIQRINKINNEIILVWGNPGLMGGSI